MLLLCRHMHIEYYFLSVIALSAVDHAKRMMHSLTQGSENQRSKSCKCLSMWRKPSQRMTQSSSYPCVQGWSPHLAGRNKQRHTASYPWALLVVGEAWQERRRRTGEDRCRYQKSSVDGVFGIRWSSQMGHRKHQEDKCTEEKERKTEKCVNLGSGSDPSTYC